MYYWIVYIEIGHHSYKATPLTRPDIRYTEKVKYMYYWIVYIKIGHHSYKAGHFLIAEGVAF